MMPRKARSGCAIRSSHGAARSPRWWPACVRAPRPRRLARAARPAIAGGGATPRRAGWGCRSAGPRPSTSPGGSAPRRRRRSWPRARAVGRGPSRSAPCWGAPPRPWARCGGGWGTHAARGPHGPRSCAMSRPLPESCCTSIPRSWGAAGTSASASPATASSAPRAGWQHVQPARRLAVHVAIDDHSRLAYAEVRPSDRPGRRPGLPGPGAGLVSRPGRRGPGGDDG